MGFTQSAGYVGFTPKSEALWPVLAELAKGVPEPDFAANLTGYCLMHGVDDILIGAGTPPALRQAITRLGWPQREDDGITIVTVPPASATRYSYILGDYWPEAPLGWMGRRVQIDTNLMPSVLPLSGIGEFRPVTVTIDGLGPRQVYKILPGATKTIALPAHVQLTLNAGPVFDPDVRLHNGDHRRLSLYLGLKPPAS